MVSETEKAGMQLLWCHGEDSTLVSACAAGTPPPVTPHRPGTVPQHTIQICGYSGRRPVAEF